MKVRSRVSSFLRYLRTGGFVLLLVYLNLVLGRLVFFGWSCLTLPPGWARIVLWLLAFALTLWFCSSVWYRRLWNGQLLSKTQLSGARRVAGPGLGRPAADIAVMTLAVWFLLTGPFAFGTYLADRERLLAALKPKESTRDAYYKAANEYAWQAADVLPFINATDTLNWTEPSSHWKQPARVRAAKAAGRDTRSRGDGAGQTSTGGYSDLTGELLVIYKILVLAPVLVAARLAWQARRERTE